MDVRILGPLEVWVAGRSLALGGTKQRAVLAMLVLHANQVVAIDHRSMGCGADPARRRHQRRAGLRLTAAQDAGGGLAGRLGRLVKAEDRPRASGRRPGPPQARLPATGHRRAGPGPLQRLADQGTQALRRVPEELAAARLGDARCGVAGRWRSSPTSRSPRPSARLAEQHLAVLQARIEADLALGRHAELVAELQALVAGTRGRAAPAAVAESVSLGAPGRGAGGLPADPEAPG